MGLQLLLRVNDRNFRTRDPPVFWSPSKKSERKNATTKPGIQQWKRKATAERHQSPSLASSTQKSSDAQAYIFGTARSWLIEGEVSALAALVQPREFISFVSRPSYLDLLSLNVIDLKYV